MGSGTLLGPEGTDRSPAIASRWPLASGFGFLFGAGLLPYRFGRVDARVFGGGVGWFAWLLFVNCIVDASIFVAKFFRAHGGCLGIRSR